MTFPTKRKKRRNPQGSNLLFIGLAAGIGWWWWQKSATAVQPAAQPFPAGPAAAIAATAVTAAAAQPTAPTVTAAPYVPSVANGNVLVSSYDAQGNPVTEWTGRGTANPQAGEIAGANPGLVQLAQYMGMTPAQTQAWIQTSQAKTGVTPPVLPS